MYCSSFHCHSIPCYTFSRCISNLAELLMRRASHFHCMQCFFTFNCLICSLGLLLSGWAELCSDAALPKAEWACTSQVFFQG
mmetsp:Transcript_71029/g.123194  ORF Transcript_71029/g.123194 Transcript_71029/m.123194 type:complete len:82 (-) Transcript_71029:31-276(-)